MQLNTKNTHLNSNYEPKTLFEARNSQAMSEFWISAVAMER